MAATSPPKHILFKNCLDLGACNETLNYSNAIDYLSAAILTNPSNKEAILSGAHSKHILGHNDYKPTNSIFTHPEPERLMKEFAGKGIPQR